MNRRHFCAAGLFAALAAGCSSKSKRTPHINVEDFATERVGDPVIRVACVGDSITYGAGIPDRETASYPADLARLFGPRFEVRNFGHNGATVSATGDVPYDQTPEFAELAEFRPGVVILMLGTNDTKPQNWKGKVAFEADYRSMLVKLKGLKPRPKIWACFPPPIYKDDGGISAQTLDEVLDGIELACDRERVPIIDLFDTLSGNPAVFPDGIHPNAKGADLMAKTVFQAVRP
ncbi:MAG TPA: GDSL-type esterase/lipase family protein [Verrucomicrobiota bacterium]|nr:GDSL-type esterase/lipase family protein [Verrucomicrobiota bacterium]